MKKILFCGGGSAGHVVPNIALCRDLQGKYIAEYAGTDGIERGICANEGIKFYTFRGVKFVRGKLFVNLALPFKLLNAVKEAKKILKECAPDAVFCKGGYVSLPPAIAAKKLNIPVFTHESDLSAGLANKIISKISVRTFTSFPETAKKFKSGIYTGSPLRSEILHCDRQKARDYFKTEDGRKVILVFGGGSGSKAINEALRKIAPVLCRNYYVIHACGKGNIVSSNIDSYRQFEYIENMGAAYAAADCAVARCGSNSAFELMANKVPTLFIPLENSASRGDQLANAEYFYKKGMCHVLRQKDLSADSLLKAIGETIGDTALKEKLDGCCIQSGNKKILAEVERVIGR